MAKSQLTVEDYVALLKNTNFATVVTEGKDDYSYFRRMEESLADQKVSFLPVGGRSNVLSLFNRRKEYARNDIAFLVDRDLWVFSRIPEAYIHRKVFSSNGYSVENDYFRDGELEDLLHTSERETFRAELQLIVEWYSFCIKCFDRGGAATISDHPNRILDDGPKLSGDYLRSIAYTGRDDVIYHFVLSDYKKLLRGKTLVELLVRHLSTSSRSVKFGYKQLMEICATRNGEHYRRIRGEIEGFFASEIARASRL